MTPLLLLLLTADPTGRCFSPADARPGWKQVSLPPDAPALAAEGGIEQFRVGEPVVVHERHPDAMLSGYEHFGRTSFTLSPRAGACVLDLEFAAPLRGAKVDVLAYGPFSSDKTLLCEKRQPGSKLSVRWGDDHITRVDIVVHDHARESPVLARWETHCTHSAAQLPLSDAFHVGGSLYYLQPPGPPVRLCHDPAVAMELNHETLAERSPAVTSVSLVPR